MRSLFRVLATGAVVPVLLGTLVLNASATSTSIPAPAAPAVTVAAPTPLVAGKKFYDVDYFVGVYTSSTTVQKKKLPVKKVWDELHRCFNCNFPVTGAPKAFPKEGQLLKLKACIVGSVGCKNAPVKYYKGQFTEYGWHFVAQDGHFDGKGSQVYFKFYNDAEGYAHLNVWAFVTKPTVPDGPNKDFAKNRWRSFAHILGTRFA